MEADEQTRELERFAEQIWDLVRRFGLDPFQTHFEIVPPTIMYEFGAYGLPGRFSHWTHGKAYHHQKTLYDYGLTKIYELVINADPSYAFLLDGNSLLQNKLVIAHVLAHCDFFKHNAYFQHTNRKMVEGASINADRIRQYEFQQGRNEVEEFLDAVLSIQEHIDPNVFIKRKQQEDQRVARSSKEENAYADLTAPEEQTLAEKAPARRFPVEPEKDLLLFIAEHGPQLKEWQRDILHIVRDEMLYFLPQMQTKIMNEGWASYWHLRIMRELDLSPEETVEFAKLHSSVLSPSVRQVNPYYVGMKLFEDIERRWDNPTEEEKIKFGRRGGEGRQKIFEVRELDNDVSFLRNYLTHDLVRDLDLYIYRQEGDKLVVVERDWEHIRDMLVDSMTNFGQPYIVVEDGDYKHSRELYLKHQYEGRELDVDYAEKTLHYVQYLWKRSVHLETVVSNHRVLISHDGEKAARTRIEQ